MFKNLTQNAGKGNRTVVGRQRFVTFPIYWRDISFTPICRESPRLLKELHHEIVPILTKINRSSLSTGIVPNDWKTALVAPVYKKGPKYKPSNYRPISLTCIASKLIAHILVSSIMTHFDPNGLLNPFSTWFSIQT